MTDPGRMMRSQPIASRALNPHDLIRYRRGIDDAEAHRQSRSHESHRGHLQNNAWSWRGGGRSDEEDTQVTAITATAGHGDTRDLRPWASGETIGPGPATSGDRLARPGPFSYGRGHGHSEAFRPGCAG